MKRLKAAAVIQYTLPGVPSIFYGDEAGVQGFGDPFCRVAYPWGNENQDLIEFYKALGAVRSKCKAFTDGDFYTLFADTDAIAYTRKNEGGSAFVAVNRGKDIFCNTVPDDFKHCKKFFGKACNDGKVHLGEYEFCIIYK